MTPMEIQQWSRKHLGLNFDVHKFQRTGITTDERGRFNLDEAIDWILGQ